MKKFIHEDIAPAVQRVAADFAEAKDQIQNDRSADGALRIRDAHRPELTAAHGAVLAALGPGV
ncbi:MAG: hypothetical protein JO307_06275 [Bryobacterales bacterium]|nr:hypothetical protein [Bryobacterales bacterium]MBV9397130.1 hypothetical protein [Bryobacterales bacterium]